MVEREKETEKKKKKRKKEKEKEKEKEKKKKKKKKITNIPNTTHSAQSYTVPASHLRPRHQ